MLICLGGVCIPVHLLLAFFVAWAHRHGYLLFLREEWFTFRYWKQQFSRAKDAVVSKAEGVTESEKKNE
ncbi:hypothetical protein M9434_001647 [Picochlorum sp. BPE23]|nr:hypothetical protein M9434_001647 [Picochlorum sp. BPE23]KAI8110362.1 hypothetical protein M9435_002038 [Picochlorum sp. BPE23]